MACVYECTYKCKVETGEEVEYTFPGELRCNQRGAPEITGDCILIRERQIYDDGASNGVLTAGYVGVAGAGIGFVFGGPPGALVGAIIGGAVGAIVGVRNGRCP